MQTSFSLAQLADPATGEAERILRTCVHCGFCQSSCPTYALLGDERDSPRGRIYLIKDMLENGKAASATVVKHIDRCLSCLACMTTCPSSVDYMRLVDHARVHIEKTYARPLPERLLRRALGMVLARAKLFRLALVGARLLRPLANRLPEPLGTLLRLAARPAHPPSAVDRASVQPAQGARRARVALLAGCVQQVLAPTINEAAVRLLTRLGCEVVVVGGAGCCGALAHHLGQEAAALAAVRANIKAWSAAAATGDFDAVIATASGCGTMIKDYGHLMRGDPTWAAPAERIAALARDVTEVIASLVEADTWSNTAPRGLKLAYHSACSLQHGQRLHALPRDLLAAAGFEVAEVPEGHLCCGSAGTYNLLQPAIAVRLGARKIANIESVAPDAIAAGNIGCMVQIGAGTPVPIAHTVELLDWASGGPRPLALGA